MFRKNAYLCGGFKDHIDLRSLIIDIGNTAVKAAWADGIVLGRIFRYQGERVRNFILSLCEKEHPSLMVISSVYEISRQDEDVYRSVCGRLLILDQAHPDVLKASGIPGWVTYDRAASIVAARHLFSGKGCVIMDLGTTMSVDVVNADGTWSGGNVSLGCRTRFKALNRYSRALPLIDTPADAPLLGRSFDESVASGVISGIMFEIEGYVSSFPGHIIVFTGGDANYFAKRMKNSIFVVCNLVLMGLALIADGYADEVD